MYARPNTSHSNGETQFISNNSGADTISVCSVPVHRPDYSLVNHSKQNYSSFNSTSTSNSSFSLFSLIFSLMNPFSSPRCFFLVLPLLTLSLLTFYTIHHYDEQTDLYSAEKLFTRLHQRTSHSIVKSNQYEEKRSFSALSCFECNYCFMLTCLCDERTKEKGSNLLNQITPSNCLSSYRYQNSRNDWHTQLQSHHTALLAESRVSDTTHTHLLPYGFGLFTTLPYYLGDVLELNEQSVSLLDHLLQLQPRQCSSVTRWHPLIHAYIATNGVAGKISAENADIEVKLVGLSIDDMVEENMFDTIIIRDSLAYSSNPLMALERIYSALRIDGTIILTSTTISNNPTRSNHLTAPGLPIPMEYLKHFSYFFDLLYETNEEVFHRINEALPEENIPESMWLTQRYFIIGTKKKVQDVFDYSNHSFLNTQTPTAISTSSQLITYAPSPLHFYLTWSTNKLMPWRLAVIDSIFHHHPTAKVQVYSDELAADPSQFTVFTSKGLSVTAHYCNYTEIFADTPILSWINIPENRVKLNFVSDALRLALVWRNGGCYIDFDAIVLQPVDKLRNVMARELYNGMVNGALLPFDKGHPFLLLLMLRFPKRVRLDRYTSGGPALQTHGIHLYEGFQPHLVRHQEKPQLNDDVTTPRYGINVYQPRSFFANVWSDAPNHKYWVPSALNQSHYEETMREQYIFHIWKQMLGRTLDSETDYVFLNSFMGKLFLSTCYVLCDEIRNANQGKGPIFIPPPPKE